MSNGSIILEVIEGNDSGKKYPLGRNSTLIGRGADCGFILSDLTCSRKHFQILPSADGYVLKDLGSGNGTKINGVKVKEHLLQDGDVIKAGKTKLKYVDPRRKMAPPQGGMPKRKPTMYQNNWGGPGNQPPQGAGAPPPPGGRPGMPPGGRPGMPPGGRPGMPPGGRPGMPPRSSRPSIPPGGRPGMPPGGRPGMPPGGRPSMPPGGRPGMPPGQRSGMPPGGRPGMPPGGPGMPPGAPPPPGGAPFDPVKAMMQAQNKETEGKLMKFIKEKKLLVIVAGVIFLLFVILIIMKVTGKKSTGPKIDKAKLALQAKQKKVQLLIAKGTGIYKDAKGRPDWLTAEKDLVEADKLIPNTDTVIKNLKLIRKAKKLDKTISFVGARINSLGFQTEMLLKKLVNQTKSGKKLNSDADIPKLFKDIKDLMSDAAAKYYDDKLKKYIAVLDKRLSVSSSLLEKLKNINFLITSSNNKSSKRKAIKLYDKIINDATNSELKQCKKVYVLRNDLLRQIEKRKSVLKRKLLIFTGSPSLIDACRTTEDIIAAKKAFNASNPNAGAVVSNNNTKNSNVVSNSSGHGSSGGSMPSDVSSKYMAKDFAGAKAAADAAAAKNPKYKTLASKIASLSASYSKTSTGNFAQKLAAYEKCLSIDASLGGKLSSVFKAGVALNAKLNANTLLAANNLEGAYDAYKKAIAAGATGMSNTLKQLEAGARKIYLKAYSMGVNSVQAKNLFRRVLKMVPSTSKVYVDANNRLKGVSTPKNNNGGLYIMSAMKNPVMRVVRTMRRPMRRPMRVMRVMKTMKKPPMRKVVVDDDDD